MTNSGQIAGRNVVNLAADNIKNLGGRIGGNQVALNAQTDLDNIGGRIEAQSDLMALAGRDINLTTTIRCAKPDG